MTGVGSVGAWWLIMSAAAPCEGVGRMMRLGPGFARGVLIWLNSTWCPYARAERDGPGTAPRLSCSLARRRRRSAYARATDRHPAARPQPARARVDRRARPQPRRVGRA